MEIKVVLEDLGGAELFEGHAVGERLGNLLDRERTIAIAGFERPAVRGHEADTKRLRIRFAQLRDIGRDLAGRVRQMLLVDFVDQDLELVSARNRAAGV